MLSGSRSARAGLARTAARMTGLAARSCLDPARDLKERSLDAAAAGTGASLGQSSVVGMDIERSMLLQG